MTTTATFQLRDLSRKTLNELGNKAKRMGLTPERYLSELVREDLALDHKARTTTLAQLMGPGRDIDDEEFDGLVEAARTRHHRRTARKR